MNAAWYKVLNALLNTSISFLVLALIALSPSLQAQIAFDGFLQGLFGGRLDGSNPTATEYTASETRLQLRAEHVGDRAVFFGRLDFIWDGADTAQYRWEFREGYMKFSVGSHLDFKVGRQTLTWGTGDLVFINDVFAKDYESFFIGRDDQYLKAPQNTLRAELYSRVGTLSLVWSPRFEPNRLPTGRRLSYFNPMADSGAGAIVGEGYFFQAALPENRFKNGELAARLQKDFGSSTAAVYFYRGFYKDPLGFDATTMVPYHPRLNVYGASVRGTPLGGTAWLEAGYIDSREDPTGNDPAVPNSSINGLAGFERQIAQNLTTNVQWQIDYMTNYDKFRGQQPPSAYLRDRVRHLLTSRWTKLMHSELITLSAFAFYSPSDEDWYLRLSTSYNLSDEVTLMCGANLFDGRHDASAFGQFGKNDNAYAKVTYGF